MGKGKPKPDPGWPAKTGNESGDGRKNAAPKKKTT